MRAKSGSFAWKTAASASAPAWRRARSWSESRLSVASSGSVSPPTSKLEPGHGLVEEPVPGGGADHRLVVQELLELVGELVRLHLADAVEHRLVAGELGVRRRAARRGAASSIRLSSRVKKTSGVVSVGELGLRVAEELGAHRVDGVLVVAQAGIAHDPAGDRLDALPAADRGEQAGGVERRRACPRSRRRRPRHSAREPVEVAGDLRRVGRGVEVGEVPFGQGAERRVGGGLAGVEGRARASVIASSSKLARET